MILRYFVMGLSLLLVCHQGFSADYWAVHSQGWHWYDDPVKEKPITREQTAQAPTTSQSPTKTLELYQKMVDEAKAKAVLEPTQENVYRFLQLQKLTMDKATDFSKMWQQVIWQHPELKHQDSYPTSFIEKQAYNESHESEDDKVLYGAAKTYGLFFFFAGGCPYCHRFAPVFQRVADKYDFDVVAVTLDGGSLPEYPNPTVNKGQAQKLHVTKWPAVYLVNAKKREIVPVSYGLITEDELKKRLVVLSTGLKAKEAKDEQEN